MIYTKKLSILFIAFTLILGACHSKDQSETRDIQLLTDSTAYHNNSKSDTSTAEARALLKASSSDVNHKSSAERDNNHSSANTSTSGSSTSGNNSAGAGNSNSGNSSSTQQSTQKKGWSKAAQGAVIGGVGGAIGGAIISKKKGTGAAIGGAVGAAGGYIIGRDKDKKDGRVKKQ
ncbi:MAG: YMGG-like glycine zipper-containing protein [Ginsengibacter sp.]